MFTLFLLSTIIGGLLTARGLWYTLDLAGRRDVFVVRPLETLRAHSKQMHIGGVAAEAQTTARAVEHLVVTGQAPASDKPSSLSWNRLSLTVCTFGLGGLLGESLALEPHWMFSTAVGCGVIGAATGIALHALRRRWD